MATKAAPAQRTPVTFEDGQTLEFVGKTSMLTKHTVNPDGSIVSSLYFKNGTSQSRTFPATLATALIEHGLEQKIRDAGAGAENLDDYIGKIENVCDQLESGTFSKERAKSTGPTANARELAAAIAKVKGVAETQAAAWLATKTPAEKIKLRNMPAIQMEIAQMRAAKAKAAPDESVFDGLA